MITAAAEAAGDGRHRGRAGDAGGPGGKANAVGTGGQMVKQARAARFAAGLYVRLAAFVERVI